MFHLVFATDNETGLAKFSDACFVELRKAFQTPPSPDYLQTMLITRYKGRVVEWGQIIVDYGSRFRTGWIKQVLTKLGREGVVQPVSELLTRPDRRNPQYDFTQLGQPRFGSPHS